MLWKIKKITPKGEYQQDVYTQNCLGFYNDFYLFSKHNKRNSNKDSDCKDNNNKTTSRETTTKKTTTRKTMTTKQQ